MRDTTKSVFPQRIAFNVLPHVGEVLDNGYTVAEMKMVTETQKILPEAGITLSPTTVVVPVFYGHSMAVHLQTTSSLTLEEARSILSEAPEVKVFEEPGGPTPALQAANQDAVFVGRLREDLADPAGFNLWITSDNGRKGAALNALQIAELMEKCYM
jgi:aspartate-semialdehyde dehydrogenase